VKRLAVIAGALAAALWAGGTPSLAQDYPNRTVRVMTPLSAGTGVDAIMRLVAVKLSAKWGQPVVMENRPGASGFIALRAAKQEAPDGYTIVLVSEAHVAINPAIFPNMPYDPEKDFVPITRLFTTPFFALASSKGPYNSLAALLDAAKANPGKISYGTPSIGSPMYFAPVLLQSLTGTDMLHVPFKELPQIFTSVATGDVTWVMASPSSFMGPYKAGLVKPLAVAAKQRLPDYPDVPTFEEEGGPKGFEFFSWGGILALKGTPPAIVKKIADDVREALGDPEIVSRLKMLGVQPAPLTPEEFAKSIAADVQKNKALAQARNIRAD
jgi:tripartite-type tricarboxylate transporter receptor subunit TctC